MNDYSVTMEEIRNGLREDTIVANGTIGAYHSVPKGWIRLRLVNGSNARFYRFRLSNDGPFFKIAREGGFLNHPVEMASIDMAPGERNEIMIDLTSGSNATLVADLLRQILKTSTGGPSIRDELTFSNYGWIHRCPRRVP